MSLFTRAIDSIPPSFQYCSSVYHPHFVHIMWNYCQKQGVLYLFSLFLSRCVVWQDNSTTNFGFPLEPLWDFRRLQFTISRRICGICLALPSERHVLQTLQQMLAFSFYSIPVQCTHNDAWNWNSTHENESCSVEWDGDTPTLMEFGI